MSMKKKIERIFLIIYEGTGTCGDPYPRHYCWILVISNIGFFLLGIMFLLKYKNNYIWESIGLFYIGFISTLFHSHQCCYGNKHKNTKHLCRIDILSCFIFGLVLLIYHSLSIITLILFLFLLPMVHYNGKYYIYMHSLWHIGATFALWLQIITNQMQFNNPFLVNWW